MSYNITSLIFQEEIYKSQSTAVVVLNRAWENVTESEKILLEKILSVAHMSLNHVKVIALQKLDVLQWTERPKVVLSFGLDTPGLSKNEILEMKGTSLVVTSDLSSLENVDKETKQKLAKAVVELFN